MANYRMQHPERGTTVVAVTAEHRDRFEGLGYSEVATQSTSSGAPAKSATKDEWVAHAVAQGLDPDEAEAMTKTDLVNQYA